MYLRPGQVRELIAGCAERFPGGTLVFDAVPRWFSRAAVKGRLRSHGYQAPPMPFGMDAAERDKLATAHPGVAEIRDVLPVGGRGVVGALLPYVARLPLIAAKRPSVVAVRFADRTP